MDLAGGSNGFDTRVQCVNGTLRLNIENKRRTNYVQPNPFG